MFLTEKFGGAKNEMWVWNANLTKKLASPMFIFIAAIHNTSISLKLWIGMANLQFQYRPLIVDWQKHCKI
jgi:hypothetical protein